jgi:hypothetical protein
MTFSWRIRNPIGLIEVKLGSRHASGIGRPTPPADERLGLSPGRLAIGEARGETMKKILIMLAGVSGLGLAACDVDQTKNAQLPDVDVNVSGGQAPEFNVTGPEVNVGMENRTVQVPDVDVKVPAENAQ